MKNYPAIKVFELWQFSRNFTATEEIEFLNTIWPTHFLKNGICVLFRKMQTKWKPWMLENFNFKFPVWYVCFFLTEKLSPSQLYVGLLRMWNSLLEEDQIPSPFWHLLPIIWPTYSWRIIFDTNSQQNWVGFFKMTSSFWVVCRKSLKIHFRLTFISVGQQSKPKKF